MIDIYGIEKCKNIAIEDLISACMKWHFSEETGSEFWLNKKRGLNFDPIKDIKTLKDLALFEDYVDEMRTVNANALIPKGIRKLGHNIRIYESGGTTGSPQRIVDSYSRQEALGWVEEHLEKFGISKDLKGDWIHIGPSGPHIVGTSIGRLANRRGKLCYYIDFDPRWVKYIAQIGKRELVKDYVNHILMQTRHIMETQNISVMLVTPLVLEAIVKDDGLMKRVQEKVKCIIWAGTSLDEETLHVYQTYLFKEKIIMGIYGNTLMGISPQRPFQEIDTQLCVFQSYYPYSVVEIVKEDQKDTLVDYNTKGQVCVTLMTPDVFIPKHLERDEAYRIVPVEGYIGDGVAQIGPLSKYKGTIFEGVY